MIVTIEVTATRWGLTDLATRKYDGIYMLCIVLLIEMLLYTQKGLPSVLIVHNLSNIRHCGPSCRHLHDRNLRRSQAEGSHLAAGSLGEAVACDRHRRAWAYARHT